MSQSWEDLTLVTSSLTCKAEDGNSKLEPKKFGQKITDPLHVSLSPSAPPICSSLSPTRSGIRHFSPSLQVPWNLSPSPTRKAFATR